MHFAAIKYFELPIIILRFFMVFISIQVGLCLKLIACFVLHGAWWLTLFQLMRFATWKMELA